MIQWGHLSSAPQAGLVTRHFQKLFTAIEPFTSETPWETMFQGTRFWKCWPSSAFSQMRKERMSREVAFGWHHPVNQQQSRDGTRSLVPGALALLLALLSAALSPSWSFLPNGPFGKWSCETKSKEKALKEAWTKLLNYATIEQVNKLSWTSN